MSNATGTTTTNKRLPGWWYPYIFVGLFMLVLAVNLVMAVSATTTFTGLETEQAYDKGIAYNKILAKARAQQDLGWTVEAVVIPHDVSNTQSHTADLTVTYKDRDGKPVTGLSVKSEFLRPTKAGFDQSAELVEKSDGQYVALVPLTLGGQWDVQVRARRGDEIDYQFGQRVLVP